MLMHSGSEFSYLHDQGDSASHKIAKDNLGDDLKRIGAIAEAFSAAFGAAEAHIREHDSVHGRDDITGDLQFDISDIKESVLGTTIQSGDYPNGLRDRLVGIFQTMSQQPRRWYSVDEIRDITSNHDIAMAEFVINVVTLYGCRTTNEKFIIGKESRLEP